MTDTPNDPPKTGWFESEPGVKNTSIAITVAVAAFLLISYGYSAYSGKPMPEIPQAAVWLLAVAMGIKDARGIITAARGKDG